LAQGPDPPGVRWHYVRVKSGRARWIACILLSCAPFAAAHSDDCARLGQHRDTDRGDTWKSTTLPNPDLYVAGAADPREPRLSASFQHTWVMHEHQIAPNTNDFNGGFVVVGGGLGFWGLRAEGGCDGVQIGGEAAVIAQFDLTTRDELINADYFAALPVTFRWGDFSARARLAHRSSHLGDQLLTNNPSVPFSKFADNWVDAAASFDARWWRAYGGMGVFVSSSPHLEPLFLNVGLELYGPAFMAASARGASVGTLLSVNVEMLQERNFGTSSTLFAGAEVASGASPGRARLGFQMMRGFFPFGRFQLSEQVTTVGFVLQVIP
jgi:hypothetical protein